MEFKFCSLDCRYAKAITNINAVTSDMMFNAIYCGKLEKPISKGAPCPLSSVESKSNNIKNNKVKN